MVIFKFFKQMMGGRGLPKAGWGYAPSAFAGGVEALKPELWHRKEPELFSNIENQFT